MLIRVFRPTLKHLRPVTCVRRTRRRLSALRGGCIQNRNQGPNTITCPPRAAFLRSRTSTHTHAPPTPHIHTYTHIQTHEETQMREVVIIKKTFFLIFRIKPESKLIVLTSPRSPTTAGQRSRGVPRNPFTSHTPLFFPFLVRGGIRIHAPASLSCSLCWSVRARVHFPDVTISFMTYNNRMSAPLAWSSGV